MGRSLRPFDVVDQELRGAIEQMHASFRVAEAVASTGIDLILGIFAGANKTVGERNGLAEMNIVVVSAVRDKQFADERIGLSEQGGLEVAGGIVFGSAHVSLGINRVVEAPVCDRPNGK